MSNETNDVPNDVTNLGGVITDFSTSFVVGSGDGEYSTIQAALDACDTGYIVIKPGTYTGDTIVFPSRQFTWHIKAYGAILTQTFSITNSIVNLYGGLISQDGDAGIYVTSTTLNLYAVDFSIAAASIGLVIISSAVYMNNSFINYVNYVVAFQNTSQLFMTDVRMISTPSDTNTPITIGGTDCTLSIDRCNFDELCNIIGNPDLLSTANVRITNSQLLGSYTAIANLTAENCTLGFIETNSTGYDQVVFLQECNIVDHMTISNFTQVTLINCTTDYTVILDNSALHMHGYISMFDSTISGANVHISNSVLYGYAILTFLGPLNIITGSLIENSIMETDGIAKFIGCTFVISSSIDYINGYTGLFEMVDCHFLAQFDVVMSSASFASSSWVHTTAALTIYNDAVSVNLNSCSFVNNTSVSLVPSIIVSPDGGIPSTQTSVTKCAFTNLNDVSAILLGNSDNVPCSLYAYECSIVNIGNEPAIHNTNNSVIAPSTLYHSNNITNSTVGYLGDAGTTDNTTVVIF